jgi:hypothetical protein
MNNLNALRLQRNTAIVASGLAFMAGGIALGRSNASQDTAIDREGVAIIDRCAAQLNEVPTIGPLPHECDDVAADAIQTPVSSEAIRMLPSAPHVRALANVQREAIDKTGRQEMESSMFYVMLVWAAFIGAVGAGRASQKQYDPSSRTPDKQ